MELFKARYRLTVEYIVTYQEKRLCFKVFDGNKTLTFFDYLLTGNKDLEIVTGLYKQILTCNGLKPFDSCDLIISSFDTMVSNMRIKQSNALFASNKLVKNFLVDNYGDDFENRYFLNSQKVSMGNGYVLNSFFSCPSSRVREAQLLLNGLDIKNFRTSFIGQYLNEYIKHHGRFTDCLLAYTHDLYTILACVKNKQIVSNLFICKNNKIGKQKTQLTQLDNLTIALDWYTRQDGFSFDRALYVLGNKDIASEFDGLDIKINYLDEINHVQLLSKALNIKSLPFEKDPKPNVPKKKGFDWEKFLGIKKKAFTLIESAVSIAIFAVIATITSTFIVSVTNTNRDTKRNVLAEYYVNNVSESFESDPSETNIRNITQYDQADLVGTRHAYYLNSRMEFTQASSSAVNMEYQVHFQYDVFVNDGTDPNVAQPFTKYVFTIVSIHLINGSKTYLNQTYFSAVR